MPNTTYTRKTLVGKERLIYAATLHNFSFVLPVILLSVGTIISLSPDVPAETIGTYSETAGEVKSIVDSKLSQFKKAVFDFVPERLHGVVGVAGDLRQLYVGMLLILIGLVNFTNVFVKKISNEYVITSRKAIYKHGLIAVDAVELNLERIEGVKVHQSVLDRMIDRGNVLITGVGMEQVEMKKIAKPAIFKKMTLEAVEKFVGR